MRALRQKFGGQFGGTIPKGAADPLGHGLVASSRFPGAGQRRRRAPTTHRADVRRRRRGKDLWIWHLVVAAILAAVAYAFLHQRAAAAAERLVGPAKVVSGDTLEVGGRVVRLHGIAAPRMDQSCRDGAGKIYKCGHAAMRRLFLYFGADPVRCKITDPGPEARPPPGRPPGHLVARCEVKSYFRKTRNGATRGEWFDVARELVLTGFVLADPQDGAAYALDETQARAAGDGLWAGTFENPWEWRRK